MVQIEEVGVVRKLKVTVKDPHTGRESEVFVWISQEENGQITKVTVNGNALARAEVQAIQELLASGELKL